METVHDFEAANSDELELKKGDVVLVVPTASAEDQVSSTRSLTVKIGARFKCCVATTSIGDVTFKK